MQEPGLITSEAPPFRPNPAPFGIGAAIFVLLFAAGNALGGELGSLMAASINALPFALLAILAYLAGSRPNWAWLATGLWLSLMVGFASLTTLGLSIASLAGGDLGSPEALAAMPSSAWLQLGVIVLGMLFSVILGGVLLLPAVRRWLARFLPIDPNSFVHATALVTVVTIGLICTMPLLVLGEPPLLGLVDQLGGEASGRSDGGQLRDTLYGLIWTIPAAVLAVGFGITRDLHAARLRLGLVRPTWRQVAVGIGIALLMAAAVQLLGGALDWLWTTLGWPTTDEEAFAELLAYAINPVGALVIGISAGLGEELGVRGVLQPRLGLLLSNLFFVSLHALQYNWDALLIVFLVGLVCGIVRNRTNTSTAAIVHGVYNFTLIMIATISGV
ncbi:MAG: CPBP family intramembrane glutamic endopeptidase [Oscillochloridaceae bacterium umkhey_bin13]